MKKNDKKIISIEMPDTLIKALKLEAFNRDLTLSAVIRLLLEEKLELISKE